MIEESVEVKAIEDNILFLQAHRQSTCNSCSVQKGCGTSVLSQWLGKKTSEFCVENTVDAKVGDFLVVGIAESSMLKGSVLVYFMPLVSLFVCALLANSLLSESYFRDLWVSLFALSGLFVGVQLVKMFLSRLTRESLNPVILRKNIGHGKLIV